MKIAIFGAGYVGLVSGVCFAEKGNIVTCVDINRQKIIKLQNGISPIFEKDLEPLLKKHLQKQNIFFTLDAKKTVRENDIIFIAVETPLKKDNSSNLKSLYEVLEKIAQFATQDKLVVIKSTVPMGTTLKIQKYFATISRQNITVTFCNNPEFLRQGEAIKCCMYPDRVIIGVDCKITAQTMRRIYADFVDENKIIIMDIHSSELTKYACNAFLATKISFINQISQFAEKLKADIEKIKLGMSLDKRISEGFLNAGLGYGGSCFHKDLQSLISIAEENDINACFLKSVEEINIKQKKLFIKKIFDYFKGELRGKKIAIWGLAFKENTDDIRGAPSIEIITQLKKYGAILNCYDPEAQKNMQKKIPASKQVFYFNKAHDSLCDINALVVCTRWDEFKNFDFSLLKNNSCQVIFDGRNILYKKKIEALNMDYIAVGMGEGAVNKK